MRKNISWSEMRCTICRLDLRILKTRKMLKIYIIVRIEFFINGNAQRRETKTMLNLLDISEITRTIY